MGLVLVSLLLLLGSRHCVGAIYGVDSRCTHYTFCRSHWLQGNNNTAFSRSCCVSRGVYMYVHNRYDYGLYALFFYVFTSLHRIELYNLQFLLRVVSTCVLYELS